MPIKVILASQCFPGTNVTTVPLHVTIAKGNMIGDDVVDDTNVVVDNVNNPDTGSLMRRVDSMYMYNLTTKSNDGFVAGRDYTIRIRDGRVLGAIGPIILKALFPPKK